MIYLDSCALVKLIISESETSALVNYLDSHQQNVVASELALTEVFRVVRRSCYDPQRKLKTEQAVLDERLTIATTKLESIDLIRVDTATFLQAGLYQKDPWLGSLDAMHLVCALKIGPELTSFVTYDKTLARAAVEAGLKVEQPT